MTHDELMNVPLGYPWSLDSLRETFAAVHGGVGLPSKRPGLAVVVGLCRLTTAGPPELHVLDEAESADLRFNDIPAVFALAAAVTALHDHAEQILRERQRSPIEKKRVDLFNRSRFYPKR